MICSSLCRVPFMAVLLSWVWENSHSRRSSFRGLRHTHVRSVCGCTKPGLNPEKKSSAVSRGIDHLFNYLNMAGTAKASEFRSLTQPERTHLYLKTMAN